MQRNRVYIALPKSGEFIQFLRGSLLGDGSIGKLGKHARQAGLKLGHGPKQLPYLKWKQQFLDNYGISGTITEQRQVSERYKAGFCLSYHMKSSTNPLFTEYRTLYYTEDGKRKLDKEDISQIDWFGIAVWFMDDGSIWKREKRNAVALLHSQKFPTVDVDYLVELLRQRGIHAARLYNNEIRITAESTPVFLQNILPYQIECMSYKWVLYKSGELGEQPEVVNTEPSIAE